MNDDWTDALWYATFRERMRSGRATTDEDYVEFKIHDPIQEKPGMIEMVQDFNGVWRDPCDEDLLRQLRLLLYYETGMMVQPPPSTFSVLNVSN